MNSENIKTIKLNRILTLFKDIIRNSSASDDFDYRSEPVGMYTDWDEIDSDSVRVVYNLGGSHSPRINTHHWYNQKGIVITFDAQLGGNCQIFLNHHLLAVRQIGNPAGWSYLGLDSNQKIYINQDTANVLNKIMGHAYHHGMVSQTEMKGIRAALHKTDQVARDTRESLLTTQSAVDTNTYKLESMEANSNNAVTKSDLANYATKDDLKNAKPSVDLSGVTQSINKLNTQYAGLKSSIDTLALQTGHANADNLADVKKQLQDYATNITKQLSGIDLNRVKATIHRMNLRAIQLRNQVQANSNNTDLKNQQNQLQKQVTDLSNKLNGVDLKGLEIAFTQLKGQVNNQSSLMNTTTSKANEAQSLAGVNTAAISTNASRLNSADTRLVKLNQHNHKVDQRQANLTSSMSASASSIAANASSIASNVAKDSTSESNQVNHLFSGVNTNAKRLNSGDSRFAQLNQHNKKADKREADLASGINSQSASNSSTFTKLASNATVLSGSVSVVSSGVSTNSKRLNSADTKFYDLNQHNKKSDKVNGDAIKSLASVETSYNSILTNHASNINSLFSSASSLSNGVAILNNSLPAGIQSNAKEINIDGNTLASLSNGVSANASRLNSSATDTFNLKQHIKKANKRYTDAINSLSAKHTATANIDPTSLTKLNTSVATLSNNTKIDVNSLATRINNVASESADSKINSVVTSDKAVIASQSTTNNSLSNAIIANSQKTSNVESALISALSKNQLR